MAYGLLVLLVLEDRGAAFYVDLVNFYSVAAALLTNQSEFRIMNSLLPRPRGVCGSAVNDYGIGGGLGACFAAGSG